MRGIEQPKLTTGMRGLLGGPRGRPLLDWRRLNAFLRRVLLVAVLCLAVLPVRADYLAEVNSHNRGDYTTVPSNWRPPLSLVSWVGNMVAGRCQC